jgi:arsenite methyltransferase
VAGALTERDFVEKLGQAGFVDIEVHAREPASVDDLALYPLFTDDVIELMRTLLPTERLDAVATAIVLTARVAAGDREL